MHQSVGDALTLEPEWVSASHRMARGVTLETVAVRPGWRRTGLAAEMFESAIRDLPDGTEARSAWLVANRESAAWHRRMGFETVPTSVSARSVLRAAQWTDRVPILSNAGLAAEAEIGQLERDEEEGLAPDPFTFVRPIHRRPPA